MPPVFPVSPTPSPVPVEPGYDMVEDLDQLDPLDGADARADTELRAALRVGDAVTLERLIADLRQAADRREIDPATHLTRLLGAMGDCDLRPDNPAAAPYLHALSRIKTKRSGLLVRGAAKWSEANVGSALALTCPDALRHKTWAVDSRRPAATARWMGRVSAFAAAGLISPHACVRMLLGAPSAAPLPHRALKQGDPTGREFAAVMAGFKDCAAVGALKGPDFLRLLSTTDEGLSLPDVVYRQGNLRHLQAFLDMAFGARLADALTEREYLDLVTKTASGHPVLPHLCQQPRQDAARLSAYLLALEEAERTGRVPHDTLAGVLLERDDTGKFPIERAGPAHAAAIRRVVAAAPEWRMSETAARRILGLLRA
ncbi:hypothetical protein [Mitsuaria sp. GD03876]|uniref:hypothetical protein n=1 Tax=Mitsuaria sp. GD03876 TaxID=2975399 RepID=UPI002449EBD4|nr:hypothetical protein [Mitsuaria sp. GD03876]MDH0864609.1 hypothetical protein [Mitsuaria sp. GD03876]